MSVTLDPDSFGFLINDVARLVRAEFERRIEEAGISVTSGEARTLANVARAGTVRQNVLAERMGLEAMTLSSYLDRLEARGLVERRKDLTDKRAKLVSITGAADGVLEEIRALVARLREDLSAEVGGDVWSQTIANLKTIRERLGERRADIQRRDGRAA